MIQSQKTAPSIFISYAWESSNEATEPLQTRLALLQRDLLAAGAKEVFLDINHMDGDIVATMRKGVIAADIILMVCTPRYAARVRDEKTNVAYEFRTALEKREQNKDAVIPLWWSGAKDIVIPKELGDEISYDFRNSWGRAQQLVTGSNPLLRRVFGLNTELHGVFDGEWQVFCAQAFGDKGLPSILSPLQVYYEQQTQGCPILDEQDLPTLALCEQGAISTSADLFKQAYIKSSRSYACVRCL